jgi:hypothetical protein
MTLMDDLFRVSILRRLPLVLWCSVPLLTVRVSIIATIIIGAVVMVGIIDLIIVGIDKISTTWWVMQDSGTRIICPAGSWLVDWVTG